MMEHFGAYLRRERESRGRTLADLSLATKIKESSLALLEAAQLDALPARVFVRGWVLACARELKLDPNEAARRLKAYLEAIGPQEKQEPAPPVVDEETGARSVDRRRFGVVMVVLLILVVATLTLSLLLKSGNRPGGGLSRLHAPSRSTSRPT